MKEVYCKPHLPKSRVKRVFVSKLLPKELLDELRDMMIKPYILGRTPNISSELAYHPDILLNNYRVGMWFCEHDPKYLPRGLPTNLFMESETELDDTYPYDCPFNNFRLRNALVCGMRADYLIQAYADYENLLKIHVPQGYTKCCTVIVNEHAIVTCDKKIGEIMRKNGFDVLTVEDSDEIGLRGYSHGLIGGCSGKISEDTIVFTGDLNKYKFGDDIRAFCHNHRVYCYSLTNEPMYDYGGILPITEFSRDECAEDVTQLFIDAEKRDIQIFGAF